MPDQSKTTHEVLLSSGPKWLTDLTAHGATWGHMPHRWVGSWCGVTITEYAHFTREYALSEPISVMVLDPASENHINVSGPNILPLLKIVGSACLARGWDRSARVCARIAKIVSGDCIYGTREAIEDLP